MKCVYLYLCNIINILLSKLSYLVLGEVPCTAELFWGNQLKIHPPKRIVLD